MCGGALPTDTLLSFLSFHIFLLAGTWKRGGPW